MLLSILGKTLKTLNDFMLFQKMLEVQVSMGSKVCFSP